MPLALILGVCALLASPPSTSLAVRASWLISQAAQSQPDSPQSDSQQNSAPAPPTEQKTEPAPDQTQPSASPSSTEKTPSAAPAQPPKTKADTASKTTLKKQRRKNPAAQPAEGPTKVIVRNGGAPDPSVQLSPGVSAEQASRQRQGTNQLLSTTQSNLKTLAGRQLNPSQQDMVSQVREYMKQAKASADAGDLQRAHNLAFKAKLLSDELAKH